jgi:hypothetical protein
MPRVYQSDHTAFIRHRLRGMLYASAGLAGFAGMAAAAIFLVTNGQAVNPEFVRFAWLTDILAFVVAGVGLAATLVFYLMYRRRRADLDAAGDEAAGEFRAQIHRT